jgi:hypothetical protein
MGYYSAIKKNEILSFAIKWMNVEKIVLSEISQTQTSTTCSLIHRSLKSQPQSRLVITKDCEQWGTEIKGS